LVQRNAMKTWEAKHAGRADADFKSQLLSDPEVAQHLGKPELDEICSLDFHYKHVEDRFRQLGL
jgi:adenylosuccinate lyase